MIREAAATDTLQLEAILQDMRRAPEVGYVQRCFTEGRRIFIAEPSIGCIQLNPRPCYQGFWRLNIPEAQDLCVVPDARRQGWGEKLVLACEQAAQMAGYASIGISVGVTATFGAAHRLYTRLGYIPDGNGVCYDDQPARSGEMRALDDLLTLKMIKSLI